MGQEKGLQLLALTVGDYEKWAKTHYENFTVGSLLLPRHLRRHVHILYAYCRYVDDLGDEAVGDRSALLDDWERDLERCFSGQPQHPLLQDLQGTIQAFELPVGPFLRLIEANRIDQRVHRYNTFDALLHYCEHSANPVGHLFLALLGYHDARRKRLADATCTALQLTNFWQDVAKDYAMGRVYIPEEDLRRFGVTESTLAAGVATSAFRSLMEFECERTRTLFAQGLPLADTVRGRAKVDVRLFTFGGLSVLDRLRAVDYDVFTRRPVVTAAQKLRLFLSALWWLLKPGARQPGVNAG